MGIGHEKLRAQPDKLCVTVYHTDDEAFDIWKKVTGFHDDKIIRIPTDDNFWRMGDTGPCGPSTGDFLRSRRSHLGRPARQSPEEDGDRFIEIWNNVFMQYEQVDADTRVDLTRAERGYRHGLRAHGRDHDGQSR